MTALKWLFLFNRDFYNPFKEDGTLKKTLYHFPNDSWPAENINDFLYTSDKKNVSTKISL